MVRDRLVPDHGTENAADRVGPASHGERHDRDPEGLREAEPDHRHAPRPGREDDREAVFVHVRGPAARERHDHRPDRRRRVEDAEHLRPAQVVRVGREQRHRHPEEHGDEVHAVRAEELLAAARVADALDYAADARPLRPGRRRNRAHEREHDEREREGRRGRRRTWRAGRSSRSGRRRRRARRSSRRSSAASRARSRPAARASPRAAAPGNRAAGAGSRRTRPR